MAVNPINEVLRLQHNLKAAGMAKKGRPPKFSATQFYPRALENDLVDTLRAELDRLAELSTAAALIGIQDDVNDLNGLPLDLSSGFLDRSRQIGERIVENAGATFSKQVDMIIGRPYYPMGLQSSILDAWHNEFQTLCISAAQDGKKAIAATVAIAKEKGWNKNQLEAEIKKILPPETKHRAELIARTETGKLNSRCTIATYQEVGVKYYKWLTTMDGRERETHAALNNKICSVDDPEVYFTENPENPLHPIKHKRTAEMYHGHPGTDFQCRCSMVMWDPEIDGQYEVKEDQRRMEQERQEIEASKKEIEQKSNIYNNTPQSKEVLKVENKVGAVKTICNVQQKTAEMYVEAVESYSKQWDWEIRAFQSGNKDFVSIYGHDMAKIALYSEAIEAFIKDSPKWHGGDTFRGITLSEKDVNNFKCIHKTKNIFSMEGTSSWSTNENKAFEYSKSGIGNKNKYGDEMTERVVFLKNDCQKLGTSIQYLSIADKVENEILVSKNVRYKIIKIIEKLNSDGVTYFIVEEL